MKVDSRGVPITFCWWFNHYREKRLKNAENRTLHLFFFSGVVFSSVFKKCVSLMRYCHRLTFYILCRPPFVSGSLLMPYSVLIHTSLLINYSVYPLIRCSDRVNNCFSVLWDVACYQASSNSRQTSSARCYFCRPAGVRGNKHIAQLLAIASGLGFHVTDLSSLHDSPAPAIAWMCVPMRVCPCARVRLGLPPSVCLRTQVGTSQPRCLPWEVGLFSWEACSS